MPESIVIVPYSDDCKTAIKTLNVEWLEKYFAVEPNDERQLSNPQEEILDKGGLIYYAKWLEEIVGTVTLMKIDETTYELSKMAVTDNAQGKGIGKLLLEHCLKVAHDNGFKRLLLFSNTKLENAIAIYRKYGFVEVSFEQGHYKRANIKMELILH